MIVQSAHRKSNGSSFFYGYIVVMVAFFIMVTVYGAHFVFGVFFLPISSTFGWDSAMTSGAFSLAKMMQGFLAVAAGGINDRFGPRMALSFCGIVVGTGYMLMSRIDGIWQFYLFYGIIIGAGMGFAWVPLMSMVARWFVARRSLMSGIVLAGIGMGTLVAPPAVNWLIAAFGWRAACAVVGGVIVLGVVPAAQLLKRDPSQIRHTAYGEQAPLPGKPRLPQRLWTPRALVTTGQFWLGLAVFFCFGFFVFATLVHIVPYVIRNGLSGSTAAGILATIGGCSIAGKLLMGGLGDKIGNKWSFVICFTLIVIALLCLLAVGNILVLYMFAVIFGFGYGGCAVQGAPLVAVLFGLRSHGLIMGIFSFAYTVGASVGPFVVGFLFDLTAGYRTAFWVCVFFAVTAVVSTAGFKPATSAASAADSPPTR